MEALATLLQPLFLRKKDVVIKMAVGKISQSGTKEELLNDAGIDAAHIVKKVKSVLKLQLVA